MTDHWTDCDSLAHRNVCQPERTRDLIGVKTGHWTVEQHMKIVRFGTEKVQQGIEPRVSVLAINNHNLDNMNLHMGRVTSQ
jgi:hypothetical protein